MPRPAKIDLVPDAVRKGLEEKLIKNGFGGYAGLSEWLAEQGYEISKSALGYWGKDFKDRLKTIRASTHQARAIIDECPDDDGAANDALIRLVQERVFALLIESKRAAAGDVVKIARAVADIARASVSQKRLMAEARAQAFAEANKKVQEGVKKAGISSKQAKILADILNGKIENEQS
ncbi:MAG: DUF3486 family protein [Pseudomonadota bacterium]